MAGEVKSVRLKMRGINTIMRSAAVTKLVAERAGRMARAAGDGFGYVVKPHKYTARAFVQTETQEGREREARDKVLLRAMNAGR